MNKTEFIDLIAKEHDCTKIQARDALEISCQIQFRFNRFSIQQMLHELS